MKKAYVYIVLALALSAMLPSCAPYYYYPNDYADYYYYPSAPEYDSYSTYYAYPYPYPYPYRFYLYYPNYSYGYPSSYSSDYPSSRYYNYRPY